MIVTESGDDHEDAAEPGGQFGAEGEADDEVGERLQQSEHDEPASRPLSSAAPRSGVSAMRLRKPVSMSRARSVPELITENSAPCMKVIARAKVR